MKKVLMSVFLLFVLVLSPIGSFASQNGQASELDDVVLSNLGPSDRTVVQGDSITLSFDMTNNEATDLTFDITSTTPSDGSGHTLAAPQFADVLVATGLTVPVTFTLNTGQNQAPGTYSAVITATDTPGDTVTGTLNYDVIVEEEDPSMIVEGLNADGDLVLSGEEDTQQSNIPTSEFTVRNDGNVDLIDLRLSLNGNLNDDEIEIEVLVGEDEERLYDDGSNEVSLGNLNAGASSTVTVKTMIPNGIKEDLYSGLMTVYAFNYETETTQTFDLIVKVEPEVCTDGRVADGQFVSGPNSGNGLRISIDNPDDGDSFEIGEEFDVEASVSNEGAEDLDVTIEAILYNLDQNDEINTWESESVEINEDESEDFTITISFPNDDDMDADDTYVLYVKTLEDGNEDDYCNYDSVEIELDRNKDDVVVDEFALTPSVVSQGSVLQMSVNVHNIGTDKQEDVYVQVINAELGLDLSSNKFDLKEYDKSGNDALRTFTFEVPSDAVVKDYLIEAVVYFDQADESSSMFSTLTVQQASEGVVAEEPVEEVTEGTVVEGTTTTPTTYNPTGSFVQSVGSSSTFWIVGDIILAVLVIVLLVLIFRRK